MPLETASTIADLVATNPVGNADSPAALDDHIRLIKTVLKADALVVANKGAANGVATLNASSKVVQTALLADSATTATTATAANGLKTATTTVAVSSATAPSAGQVLTATSSTAAEWATPSSVSFASSAENAAGSVENKAVDPLGIREAFNAAGSAPIYACRAWVNFDGTGTVAIRASGNVSSITDNDAGDYTINFTVAMPDVAYSMVGTCNGRHAHPARAVGQALGWSPTTWGIRVTTGLPGGLNTQGVQEDCEHIFVAIFR